VVAQDYTVQPLEIGFASGQDRLLLWLPMTMTHVIDETSPLSNWKIPEDALQDADATIVILVHIQRLRFRIQHLWSEHSHQRTPLNTVHHDRVRGFLCWLQFCLQRSCSLSSLLA